MTTEYNVLAPGPVNLHPKVREALALPMIHHRTPEFDAILKRVLARIKQVFKTEQPVFILSSTGSGGMEALLVNTLERGEKLLGIDSGKFGERWCEMAKVFGGNVITHKVAWGKAVKVEDVKALLEQNSDIKIVLCQACETSTGVMHPIAELGRLIANYPETLFLVDGITALGAYSIEMDKWGIDGLVGGSQKAFMLPTGLSLLSFSQKAWNKINQVTTPRYYFDIRKELKANQNGETFFSSNVSLIRALDVVLDLIETTGLENLFNQILTRAEFTRKFAQKIGFELYAEAPSASLTALTVPIGEDGKQLDGQKIRSLLEQKYHITIMGGQDQAKGKIIRIGHMGYITWPQMQDLMLNLAELVCDLDPGRFTKDFVAQLKSEMASDVKTYAK